MGSVVEVEICEPLKGDIKVAVGQGYSERTLKAFPWLKVDGMTEREKLEFIVDMLRVGLDSKVVR